VITGDFHDIDDPEDCVIIDDDGGGDDDDDDDMIYGSQSGTPYLIHD
jgi:hypothetical protein